MISLALYDKQGHDCSSDSSPVVRFRPVWLEAHSLLSIMQCSVPVAAAQVGCSSVAEQCSTALIACNGLAVQLDSACSTSQRFVGAVCQGTGLHM